MCGFFPDWGNVSEKWWIIYVTPVRTERQGDMMGSENILCVKGIKKSFGGVHALKGVDLTIKRGKRIVWQVKMDVENLPLSRSFPGSTNRTQVL